MELSNVYVLQHTERMKIIPVLDLMNGGRVGSDRILGVEPLCPDHSDADGYGIIEAQWDEMAGNTWGWAIDAPARFDTQQEAQAWIDRVYAEQEES